MKIKCNIYYSCELYRSRFCNGIDNYHGKLKPRCFLKLLGIEKAMYMPTDEAEKALDYLPLTTMDENRGPKMREGKPDWSILPYEAIEFVIPAFEYGVKKYGAPFTYRAGIPYSELFAATMRHLISWFLGEEKAQDSGVHHLSHAIANLLMIITTKINHDDRFDDRKKVKIK